ncbi:uncharacterized protein LAESUDRAFT_812178 [Laetiporus sulphureus 93-53]|uniref:Uncharacterized protein n=1 Tax=Laetiporus sulphureus 93-53 TaxID=1314785 RepID=A0A165EQT6_9APHY|nr:uncharacterized protein LAESUDRAFT_812178 [Laetiporus sulphureus 93-53]KZT07567.1 hypothetical protein LAESUDRAFT_812178 [Laetiporus sulphureus 93-53]
MVDVAENKVKNKSKGRADDNIVQEHTGGDCRFPGLDKMVREAVAANTKAAQYGPRTSTPARSHGVIRGTGSGVHVPSGGSSGSRNLGAPSGVSGSPFGSSVNIAVRTAPAARVPIKKVLHELGPNPDASVQGQQLIAQYRKASKPKKRKKPSGAQCQQEEQPVRSGSSSSVVNNVSAAQSFSSSEVTDSAVESEDEDVVDWPPYYVFDPSLNWDHHRPPPLYEAWVVNGKLKRYPDPGDGGEWYPFWSTPHDLW